MTNTIDTLPKEKKATAVKIVTELAEKHGGTITPEIILDAAKSKRSPLHHFFCWDDTEAANEYRRIQAATMIRRIKVTYTPSEGHSVKVRAFVNVVEPDDNDEPREIDGHGINSKPRGIYVGFEYAVKNENYRDQIIEQCKSDIKAFRTKYSAISEARKIIESMDMFETEISAD